MRGLPPVGCTFRVRRWDAVVLGSALPGLIAAIRLGMRGLRVLILEEHAAAVAYPGIREPFMRAGSGSDGVLGSCLKALGIPLIDRRRIRAAFPAYQVALPKARVDVGDADRTAEELEAWNLSPEQTARNLVASLREGCEAQQRTLLNAEIYTGSRRIPRLSRRAPSLPQEPQAQSNPRNRIADPVGRAVAEASPLAAFCDAQLRALSDFAEIEPPTTIQTRLLGAALGGAAEMVEGHRWLRGLLDQRIVAPAALILRRTAHQRAVLLRFGIVVVASLGLLDGAVVRAALLGQRIVGKAALVLRGQIARSTALQHFRIVVDAELVLLRSVLGGEGLGSGDRQNGCNKGFELKHFVSPWMF